MINEIKKMIETYETLEYREYGLNKNLILIENCDEWVYCIDCNNNKSQYLCGFEAGRNLS